MKFSEDKPDNVYFIQKYDTGRIIILDRGFDKSLIIHPQGVIEDWPASSIESLELAHFEPIVELSPEVVLLGTGERLNFPRVEVYSSLINLGVGVEVMDTGAACRTYNILIGEGRNVVAGLIL